MSPEEIRNEYKINEDFHAWFDIYLAHSVFSFDILLEDPIVIYSAEFWKNEREKLEKVSISH